MNKLDEILKPKLTKDEAVVLLKLMYKRFAEILEKNRHLCVGDDCETCFMHDDCEYIHTCYDEMWEVADLMERALNINIWFDWEAEYLILRMWRIKPDDDDEDWVYSHTLNASVWQSQLY